MSCGCVNHFHVLLRERGAFFCLSALLVRHIQKYHYHFVFIYKQVLYFLALFRSRRSRRDYRVPVSHFILLIASQYKRMGCSSSNPAATAPMSAEENLQKEPAQGDTSGMNSDDMARLNKGPKRDEIKIEAEAIFHRVDVDGSRALDKEEFLSIASNNTSKNAKKADAMQSKKDKNATALMEAPRAHLPQLSFFATLIQPQTQCVLLAEMRHQRRRGGHHRRVDQHVSQQLQGERGEHSLGND
jgi:hypothetical protein